MLSIKDLSAAKELDSQEMADIVGGSNFTFNGGVTIDGGTGSIVSLGDGNNNTVSNSSSMYPYPQPVPCHVPYGQYKKYA